MAGLRYSQTATDFRGLNLPYVTVGTLIKAF